MMILMLLGIATKAVKAHYGHDEKEMKIAAEMLIEILGADDDFVKYADEIRKLMGDEDDAHYIKLEHGMTN